MRTKVKVEMKPVDTILTRLGVNKTGDVQMQLTRIVNKRITRYMPFRTGALSTKLKYISSPTEITVMAPYARYQYYGKVMVNAKTGKGPAFIPGVGYRYRKGTVLRATDRDLNYDKFVVRGEVHTMSEEAYTSHNTNRLDVEGTVKKIMTTEYVQNALAGIPNF